MYTTTISRPGGVTTTNCSRRPKSGVWPGSYARRAPARILLRSGARCPGSSPVFFHKAGRWLIASAGSSFRVEETPMSSALKHPCDEEFIRSTRAEAVTLRPEVAAGNGYPGLGGRVRALRRTRPWGVILDHLFPHGRSDGVRTCDPGPCGDYGGVELGGDQALGSRLGDQQLLLPDSRPPGNCRPRHHHVRQLRREPGRPHVPLGSAARCQAAVGGREAPAGAAEAPASIDAGSRAAVEQAIDEAYFSGYRVVMLVATAASLDECC
jgi:hypothetical protein